MLGVSTIANDGIYYTSGSLLVPTRETDIAIASEVLTLTLREDGWAQVDVMYQFDNQGDAKAVEMAFEADAPYNTGDAITANKEHPHIRNFSVEMNGKRMGYTPRIIARTAWNSQNLLRTDYTSMDTRLWKMVETGAELYNADLDSIVAYSYGYLFEAHFKQGINTVHHTYAYHMSESVMYDFELPYWLIPASRWAGGEIGDFTLRVIDQRGKGFCMADSLFAAAPFQTKQGESWQVMHRGKYVSESMLVAMGGSAVEWHAQHFRPTDNITLYPLAAVSPMHQRMEVNEATVVEDERGNAVGYYLGHQGEDLLIEAQDVGLVPAAKHRLMEYKAEHGQGVVMIGPEYQMVNVRKEPSLKSEVVTTITDVPGELPNAYPCLGFVPSTSTNEYRWWYHIHVGDKTGYVSHRVALWRAVNLY